ncbi:stage II sporulation protein R [Paenibacillus solisilvae]|uniref:Stage II sporulation protein R n=1 Tax=Paenibacillus solisilvae TaxID=2486751 RepID=A0ABW0VSB9_9BACL
MIRTYSRFPYRTSYTYLFFAIVMLLMCWEGQRADAAIAGGDIPKDSIRLRILANSDSAADQAVKRYVRDAVVAEINTWVSGPQTIDQARQTIRAHIHDIEQVIGTKLASRGFTYGFKAELSVVPFPTKIYGNKVYPAGNYEALRITLGSGAGQNWWCVLFPPLCFVDAVSGEASAADNDQPVNKDGKAQNVSVSKQDTGKQTQAAAVDAGAQQANNASAEQQEPEVKFFLWEMIKAIINFIKNLFS